MKRTQSHKVGLTVSGCLIGFAIGVATCATFFLPAHANRNGVAMFVASSSGFVGLMTLFLIWAEMIRGKRPNDK
jgi:hypothetical protein